MEAFISSYYTRVRLQKKLLQTVNIISCDQHVLASVPKSRPCGKIGKSSEHSLLHQLKRVALTRWKQGIKRSKFNLVLWVSWKHHQLTFTLNREGLGKVCTPHREVRLKLSEGGCFFELQLLSQGTFWRIKVKLTCGSCRDSVWCSKAFKQDSFLLQRKTVASTCTCMSLIPPLFYHKVLFILFLMIWLMCMLTLYPILSKSCNN